jgi:hypothetical protein
MPRWVCRSPRDILNHLDGMTATLTEQRMRLVDPTIAELDGREAGQLVGARQILRRE